jgi:hypothetical protein
MLAEVEVAEAFEDLSSGHFGNLVDNHRKVALRNNKTTRLSTPNASESKKETRRARSRTHRKRDVRRGHDGDVGTHGVVNDHV